MSEPQELWDYARQATAGITGAADRRAARDELHEHALARYEDALAAGASPDEALQDTLERLGDPASYAGDLRQAHRLALTTGVLALLIGVAVAVVGIVLALIAWFFWANGAFTVN